MNDISPFIFPGIADEVKEDYLLKSKTWNGLTLDIILEATSFACRVRKETIMSSSRKHEVVRARTIFMMIAKALMGARVVDIGSFIRRDHSSVSAAQLRHNNWMSTYDEYAYLYNKTFKDCAKHIISYDY